MADASGDWSGVSFGERLKSYLRTQKGIILAAEILLSFIVFICYAASWSGGYMAGAAVEMVITMIYLWIFVMMMDKRYSMVYWTWSDLLRASVGATLYIITSLICLSYRWRDSALIAGAAFGLIAGVLFGYDTYTIYLQIKSENQRRAAAAATAADIGA